jgi:hypothetical protein
LQTKDGDWVLGLDAEDYKSNLDFGGFKTLIVMRFDM